MNEKLAALIAKKAEENAPVYKANPYWEFRDGHIIDKKTNDALDFNMISRLVPDIIKFFQMYWNDFQAESQVLIVTTDDWEKMKEDQVPTLPCTQEGLVIAVLPQDNTGPNTRVSDTYWQNKLVNRDITPVARIHSHHILSAYQSFTDWSTLNSGTLEIVVGKVLDDVPEVAYWLDTRGEDTKDTVFRTIDMGKTIHTIPCGNPNQDEATK